MITNEPISSFYDIVIDKLGATNPTAISTIYENNPILAIQENGLPITTKAVNKASLRNLTLLAYTDSIDEMVLPVFLDTDTEFQRNQKTIQAQWASAHYKLIFWRKARGGAWVDRGCLPINRVSGYRDLVINAFDFISDDVFEGIGHSGAIGYSFEDAGFGLPRPADRFRLFGNVVQELQCYSEYKDPVSLIIQNNTTVGTTAVTIADANTSRTSFSVRFLFGAGTAYVKLGTGPSSASNNYTLTLGQSTPLDTTYKEVITAVSTVAGQRLQVVETIA